MGNAEGRKTPRDAAELIVRVLDLAMDKWTLADEKDPEVREFAQKVVEKYRLAKTFEVDGLRWDFSMASFWARVEVVREIVEKVSN